MEQNANNAMRRQRAELLVSLEAQMSTDDRTNVEYFPRWLFWYRPVDGEEQDDSVENGVINGVARMLRAELRDQSTAQSAELRDQSTAQADKIERLDLKMVAMDAKLEARQDAMNGLEGQISEMQDKMDENMEAILRKLGSHPLMR